eukprot:augustus_masked-scaffold_41-processed-gene-2.14-mRNA-1 protein AED:0.14 eAED:0.81 QI:0/-1/0/1/-1/1/1/0/456
MLNPLLNLQERAIPLVGSSIAQSRETYETNWKRSISLRLKPIRDSQMSFSKKKGFSGSSYEENPFVLAKNGDTDFFEKFYPEVGSSCNDPKYYSLRQKISRTTNELRQPQLQEYFEIGEVLGSGVEGVVRKGVPKMNINYDLDPTQVREVENNHGFNGKKIVRMESIEVNQARKRVANLNKRFNQVAAVKTVEKGHSGRETEVFHAVKENGKHPNICEYIHTFDSPIRSHILTEYLSGGDLFTVMNERDFEPLLQQHAAEIILRILTATSFLHSINFCHLDIKLENIMRRNALNVADVVLIDFGHAGKLNKKGKLLRPVGSPSYAAPEIILNKEFSAKSDVWSLGVVLHIALLGFLPFPHLQQKKWNSFSLADYGVDGGECDPFSYLYDGDWEEVDPAARDLCKKMLTVDVNERISVEEALQHEWFENYGLAVDNIDGKNVVVRREKRRKRVSIFA